MSIFVFMSMIIHSQSVKSDEGLLLGRYYFGNEKDHIVNSSYSIHFATHQKRIRQLTEQLRLISYGQCPHLKHIYITWVDSKHHLPTKETYKINSSAVVPITILASTTGHISDRFILPDDISTDTVLIMDDDQYMEGIDIDNTFIVYKENHFDNRIFGYRARFYSMGKYYISNYKNPYNIVLMNFAFLSVDMIKEYFSDTYKNLRQYCINIHNCEDILMNYIVSNKWQMSPIAMQIPSRQTKFIGSNFEKKALSKRERCCHEFQNFFGYDVLGSYDTNYFLRKVW